MNTRLVAFAGFALGALAGSSAGAGQMGHLYAYANPLSAPLSFADHTWVTSYPERPKCPGPAPSYWYSTGDCHPSAKDHDPRPLGDGEGDAGMAQCIAEPDVSTFDPGPATALIKYGIDGVCHQIANRILAATGVNGKSPVTVSAAHGYWVSRFAFGEYGTPAQWARLRSQCGLPAIGAVGMHADLAAMAARVGADKYISILQAAQDQLRTRIVEIGRLAASGSIPPRRVADEVNKAVNASLRGLAKNLGPEEFQRVFDWPAEQDIVLVRPDVAARVQYKLE